MPSPQPLPNIKRVLAVASGKGGVGKTTVTVNVALALQALGRRVGIFDADLFGPNVPQVVPVLGRIPLTSEISRSIDVTHPLMAGRVADSQAEPFLEIARAVAAQL